MNEIHCLDETLDINSTQLYQLIIQVSLDGFCFSLLNSINKKYIALKYFPLPPNIADEVIYEKIEEILNKEELLNQSYKSAQTLYLSPKYTLIPNEFYSTAAIKKIFKLNHPLNALDEIHYNEIKPLNAKLLFSIPNQIANPIYQHFSNVKFYHHSSPLLYYTLNQQNKDNQLRININGQFFDLIICEGQDLKMQNTFIYKTPEDILYYIMYSLKAINILPEKANINCSGFASKSGEIIKLLKQYFPNIKFQTPDSKYIYSYTFNKIPSHTFVNLLNLPSCEL